MSYPILCIKIKNGLSQAYCRREDFSNYVDVVHQLDTDPIPEGYLRMEKMNSKPDVPVGYHLNYKFVKTEHIMERYYCLVKDGTDLDQLEVKDYENAVQDHLNAKVQERGYDDVYTCLSYKDDPFPKFRDEAAAVLAWRSSVWLTAQNILNKWQNGEIEQPTIQEVLDQLPELVW